MAYKFYYFDIRGSGEAIRLILSYGGVEFEDIRIPCDNILSSKVPSEIVERCTWGKIPQLEFDGGKKLNQTMAIVRYLAKQFNLVPEDEFEAGLCDEYVDTSRELFTVFAPCIIKENEHRMAEILPELLKITEEKYLSKFEEIVKANGNQRFVGTELTWTDIYITYVINQIEVVFDIDLLKNYPELKSLSQFVFNIPRIKAWIDKRPETKY